MDRRVEDGWVVVEEVGRTVASVHIPVKNGHFPCTVLLLCNSSSYSYVVIKAEAADLIAIGVMARWAHDSERLINDLLLPNLSHSLDGTTS